MAVPRKDNLLAPYAANWCARLSTDYAMFGLSAAQAAALEALYQPYAEAWSALKAARAAGIRSESQTSDRTSAKAPLLSYLRELYALVQASRSVSDANKALLGVTSRRVHGTPLPPPGAVSKFRCELNGNGALTIKWTSNNPPGAHGTLYQIWRKVGDGPLAYCGVSGAKRFTDNTLPAGTTSVTYQVQAVRSTTTGPWAQYNVTFGTAGSAGLVSAIPNERTKIAA